MRRPWSRPVVAALAWGTLWWAGLACGSVRMECNVCGNAQTFNTCQDLYCRYLGASSLCESTDLEACYRQNACPSPYFLFCPAEG